MKIDAGNHPLTKLRPKWKLVEEAVKEMLEARVIECSKYLWSFPVVTFRALYNITKPLYWFCLARQFVFPPMT